MKKVKQRRTDPDMLPEYAFRSMVRGKYAGRVTNNSRVFLVPDSALRGQGAAKRAQLARAVRSKCEEIRQKVDELERLVRAVGSGTGGAR